MEADECNHERTISLSGKTSDMCYVHWPDGRESDGYVPSGIGFGGGDYLEVKACLDCKQVIDMPDAMVILEAQAEKFDE